MTPRPTGIPTSAYRSARDISVIWHDVECGAYAADLPLWEELSAEAEGLVLDLGCGTGRVALHLARRGHAVVGLDTSPDVILALGDRAKELPVDSAVGDVRGLSFRRPSC